MGWSIGNIDNTVKITKACAKELLAAASDIWDDLDNVREGGCLTFNSDHSEHMDYLHRADVLAVLAKHRVNGDITFGSMEGDNAGCFWGYRFKDGVMKTLTGEVVYRED